MARSARVALLLSLVSLMVTACADATRTQPAGPPLATACQTLPTSSVPVDADGGRVSLPIQAATGCQWMASVPAATPWAVVETGSGAGPGTVTVRIDPNRTFQSRSALILLRARDGQTAGREVQALVVGQRAATCLFAVNPVFAEFGDFGTSDGSGDAPYSVEVLAEPADCQWTATSDVPWIRLLHNADHGTGNGSIRLSVWGNIGGPSRLGVVAVAGLSGVNPAASLSVLQRAR
ncbi:MAG: BACON domain-containing carbohydrate-binding protein [Vicinamibacterales bacterium]